MMLCRLCMANCNQSNMELFDYDGQRTSVCNTVVKYFEKEIMLEIKQEFNQQKLAENAELKTQVICLSCWQHINDFHRWSEEVVILQKERLKKIQQNDLLEFVKLEKEVDVNNLGIYADSFAASICDNDCFTEDPVAIGESAIVERSKNSPTVNDNRSYDDMPLLTRKRLKSKKPTAIEMSTRTRRTKPRNSQLALNSNKVKVELNESLKEKKNSAKENDALIAKHFKGQLPCDLCDNLCPDFSELRTHFREVHKYDKGYVLCCKQKYSERCQLVDHLQVHLNPQKYQCSECGKCSANGRSLVAHMRSVHRPNPLERRFECEICHKKFAKQSILKGHLETHVEGNPDHVCKECGKGFVLESRLNIHVRNVHSTVYRSVCDQCGKSFHGSQALKSHMVEHVGGIKPHWPCDQCDAQLHSKFSLGRHKRVAHPVVSTEYICDECGKVAFTEGALKAHKRYMHQQERIHKCTICEKAFKASQALKEHMTTHTGEDLYQCPHCPRMFKVNANLHHHRKRKHPKEWEENRRQRQMSFKRVDLSTLSNSLN